MYNALFDVTFQNAQNFSHCVSLDEFRRKSTIFAWNTEDLPGSQVQINHNASISLSFKMSTPTTAVLGITSLRGIIKVPLDNVIRMWVDEGAQRCRACWKPLTLAGRNRNRKFNDHVLKHVSLTVCGICYLTGCTEHITRHCRNFHRQKTRCFPHAYLGRFVIHPNLLEPFIKFSRGRGMTDRRQTSERRLLTRNFQVHLSPR